MNPARFIRSAGIADSELSVVMMGRCETRVLIARFKTRSPDGWWARQASGLRVLKRAIRTRVSHLPIMTTDNSESAIPADRINRAGFIGIEGACPYKGIARKQPPHDCGPKGPPANIKFTAMKEKIGFVGVGRMGANMARRLGDCGYRITAVYDAHRPAAAALARELDARHARTLAAVTAAADVIFT